MNWLNVIGLILDMIGVVLLFFFGLRSRLDEDKPDSPMQILARKFDPREKQYKRLSSIGFILVFLGFVLQLMGAIMK
ncbi:MAG TPA: hypothetical protein VGQ59_17725 [Cyclobacteriaceae bacterium]|jgi:uncharacterized membrane protein|nr:hypothetical protein [Cyclobacteriaceae bacterium]